MERALKFTTLPDDEILDFSVQTTASPTTISSPPDADLAVSRPSRRVSSHPGLDLASMESFIADYLLDCDYRLQSQHTIATRRIFLQNLMWFLRHRGFDRCGTQELKQFFVYLQRGHTEEGGRWGQARYSSKPLRPVSIKDYYINLRCFFQWLVDDGALDASPLAALPKPVVRVEQVQPFSPEQIQALRQAARRSVLARRNEAILLFLYDTGVRASELCHLKMKDLDLSSRHAYVLGKGNKHRMVYFSRETGRVLALYLRQSKREPDQPVFLSATAGVDEEGEHQPLTRSGLLLLIKRLGKAAGIKGMKVSPHVFRHSAAIQLLRNGCDVYSLMSLMGHSSLTICQRYLKLSQSDLQEQHRRCSPVETMEHTTRSGYKQRPSSMRKSA